MKIALRILAVVLGLSSAFANAKVDSFPADNFSIDVPPNWESVQLPSISDHAHAAAAGKDPKNSHFYSVLVSEAPARLNAASFLEGMQSPLLKKGWKPSEIRDTTIHGNPFAVFTMTREANQPPFMMLATTFTKENIYTIQVGLPSGSVEDAPDLNAIVQSFQFLKPVESLNRHDMGGSAAYEAGRVFGRFLGFVLVGGIVLYFIFKKAKSNR